MGKMITSYQIFPLIVHILFLLFSLHLTFTPQSFPFLFLSLTFYTSFSICVEYLVGLCHFAEDYSSKVNQTVLKYSTIISCELVFARTIHKQLLSRQYL